MTKLRRSQPERAFEASTATSDAFTYENREYVAHYKTSYLPDWVFDTLSGHVILEIKEWLPPHEMRRIREVAAHYAKEGVLFVVAVYFRYGLPNKAQVAEWPTRGEMKGKRLCAWLHHHNIHFIPYNENVDVTEELEAMAEKYYVGNIGYA